jgi:hypothetical protein
LIALFDCTDDQANNMDAGISSTTDKSTVVSTLGNGMVIFAITINFILQNWYFYTVLVHYEMVW